MALSVEQQLLEKDEQLSALVDEVMVQEGFVAEKETQLNNEIQAARNREVLLLSAAGRALSYAIALEQKVVLPAIGRTVQQLDRFHEVAADRAKGHAAAEAAVNTINNPRLAALFNQMRTPNPKVVADAAKHANERASQISLEDSFTMATTLATEADTLQNFLNDTATSLGAIERHRSPSRHGSPTLAPPSGYGTTVEEQKRINDLTAEVERLRQAQQHHSHNGYSSPGGRSSNSYGADGHSSSLAKQLEGVAAEKRILEEQSKAARAEVTLMQQRCDALAAQVHGLEEQNNSLNQRLQLQAQGANDAMYNEMRNEIQGLRHQLREADLKIQANNEEKIAVAERFDTIQKAWERNQANQVGGTQYDALLKEKEHLRLENTRLEDDVNDLQERLKENKQRDEEKVRKLHKEKLLLQQELANAAASKESNVERFLSDVHRSQQGDAVAAVNGAMKDQVSTQQYQTKIKAFEMTIAALNAELAQLEDGVLETQQRADTDKAQLKREFESERRRLLMEQEECDRVLERLNSELERVLSENEELRLRIKSNGAARPVALPAGTFRPTDAPAGSRPAPGVSQISTSGPIPLPVTSP